MNTIPQFSSVRDYFARPCCSDDAADRAYQRYLDQGFTHSREFTDWLEAEAWNQMALGRPLAAEQ